MREANRKIVKELERKDSKIRIQRDSMGFNGGK